MECGDLFVDNLRGPYLDEGKRAWKLFLRFDYRTVWLDHYLTR